jgi:hypothetical protein
VLRYVVLAVGLKYFANNVSIVAIRPNPGLRDVPNKKILRLDTFRVTSGGLVPSDLDLKRDEILLGELNLSISLVSLSQVLFGWPINPWTKMILNRTC